MHRSCGRLSGVSSSAGVCAAAARRGLPASRRRGGLAQQQHNASVLAPRRVGPRASTEGSSSVLDNLDNLALVKKVALSGKVFQQISAREMFEALIAINQIKSKKPENLSKVLAGNEAGEGGSYWKLVYTVGKKNLNEATSKGTGSVGGNGGNFFPVTAVQNWNEETNRIQNGIFILGVFSLIFSGDFELVDKSAILYFDFDRLDISLGPLSFGFDLPANEERVGKKRPFFIWLHADEDIAIGRGRGGGIAVWKKVDKSYREDEGVYV